MEDKKINNNEHPYVNLDLPSGTLWATMNVGASKPSESGLYFQWGDTNGYTKEQIGKDKQFNWADYKWNPSGDGETLTKYANTGVSLELEDDAANANMGGDWHIPTPSQIQELLDNTTSTWSTLDDVNGRLFTSKKDSSKSIFIPAAGDALGSSVYINGRYGNIWSSMLSTYGVNYGQYLYFNSDAIYPFSLFRFDGLPIRGVIG